MVVDNDKSDCWYQAAHSICELLNEREEQIKRQNETIHLLIKENDELRTKLYDELLGIKITDKELCQYCEEHFQRIDPANPAEKLLGLSYHYAKDNHLREYQARSFASELTAFLTNTLIDTDVSLIYREEWVDSHLFKEYEKSNSLSNFIEYMLEFYKSSKSWRYERISKYLQFRVTQKEKEMFYNLPPAKPIDKFNWLLRNYDYGGGFSYEQVYGERIGLPIDTSYSINVGTSQYECFMAVQGKTKTDKFLNLLYYGNILSNKS